MKSKKSVGWTSVVAVALWVAVGLAVVPKAAGQAPGLPGYNAVVGKLFNDIPAFTAVVETALTNSEDKSRLSVPMRMMKREERLRIEVDFTKLKGSGVDLQGLAAMQNIGMSRMNSLILPANRAMHVLFPELKFASHVGLSEDDLPAAGFKVSKKAVGKDTLNGQACVRQQVVLTDAEGKKTEATIWEAAALNKFPVRIAFQTDGSSVVMNFSEVNLAAPPEDQFVVPSDYRKFDSMTTLMQEAVTRILKSGK